MTIKALGICGSLRTGSFNFKLLEHVCNSFDKSGYLECKILPQKYLELPLMNEDLEKSALPESIIQFRTALAEAKILIIASPEYNGFPTPALKNAIDWASRAPENLWAGKTVLMISASPGSFAGIRGLLQLRTLLSTVKAWVLPEQVMLAQAHKAFDESGKLKDEFLQKQIDSALISIKNFTAKI